MPTSGSPDGVDDLLAWRTAAQREGARLFVSSLGFVAVVVASIVVWTRLGLGYGALVAVVGMMTLAQAGWLAIALLGVVWWRGGRHDVLVGLAIVASAWWLVRSLLSWPLQRVFRLYAEERSATTTELQSVPAPVERALGWLGPRDGAPVRTSELLIALITTDPAVRWGALSDVVLRPGGTAELDGDLTTVPMQDGSATVTAATARALRLANRLGETYELPVTAPLVALALVLEGPAAEELLNRAGVTRAEALDLLQGDPLGGDLEDLGQARAAFGVIEVEAAAARAAAREITQEHKPWLPRVVNAVAVALTVIVVMSAVDAARGIRRVLNAGDQLELAVADLQAGSTDEAIQNFATVAQEYPDSVAALFGLSCSLWDIGYRDHAFLNFAGMLAAGYQPTGQASNCFVTAPADVGIGVVRLDRAVRPYVADPADQFDQELLELVGDATAAPDSYWQAELVLACLNHRNGFRLVAGSNFLAAEMAFTLESFGVPVRRVEIPEECLEYANVYRAVSADVVMPSDANERFYVPGESPVPPEYDTGPGATTRATETDAELPDSEGEGEGP